MKLLMVSHYFESHRSGLELIAGRLARELVRLKQDVVWLASDVTPLCADAGREQHPAAALDLDSGALIGADAGAFDVAHDADAHAPTRSPQLRLLLGNECAIADRLQCLIENLAIIATVVMQRREILIDDVVVVGESVGRDEVPPSDLGAVEPKLARRCPAAFR